MSVETGKLKKSRRKTALLGAVSLASGAIMLAIAAPAIAEKAEREGPHKAHLEKVDTNKDGNISKAEAEAARAGHFAEADLDGNGSVSFEEFEALAEKRRQMKMKNRFERSDKNGDGVLTTDELGARHGDRFARMDLDGDGEVTMKERKEAHKKMRKHRRHGHHGD